MKYHHILVILLVIIFFAIGSLTWRQGLQAGLQQLENETVETEEVVQKYVKIAGKTLKTELALTADAQTQGLSGRVSLKEDESMLFVFDQTSGYAFWMKEMNFPIDIIWISEDLRVVYIKKNATPESFPETFTSGTDARYVLETVAHFSENNNLREGDRVEFLSN